MVVTAVAVVEHDEQEEKETEEQLQGDPYQNPSNLSQHVRTRAPALALVPALDQDRARLQTLVEVHTSHLNNPA